MHDDRRPSNGYHVDRNKPTWRERGHCETAVVYLQIDCNVQADAEGGPHEMVEAEVLAKGQVENSAGHCHELPAAMTNICTAAFD